MAKLSLAEASSKLDEEAHNSNIQNLAGALRYLSENERAAEEAYRTFKLEADKLRTEIVALAEKDAANLTYEQVKLPHSKARTISLTFTPGNSKGW